MKWWWLFVVGCALSACTTPGAVPIDCETRLVPINAPSDLVRPTEAHAPLAGVNSHER